MTHDYGVKGFRKRVDREKLGRYLKRYGSNFRKGVIETLR